MRRSELRGSRGGSAGSGAPPAGRARGSKFVAEIRNNFPRKCAFSDRRLSGSVTDSFLFFSALFSLPAAVRRPAVTFPLAVFRCCSCSSSQPLTAVGFLTPPRPVGVSHFAKPPTLFFSTRKQSVILFHAHSVPLVSDSPCRGTKQIERVVWIGCVSSVDAAE